jgi:hypothetical protein
MPEHSSMLYARNVQSLLELLVDDEGALNLNFDDEIIKGACITREGEIVHPGAQKAVEAASGAKDAPKPSPDDLAPAEPEAPSPEPDAADPSAPPEPEKAD